MREAWSRQLIRDVRLSPQDLIWPVFIHQESSSMPIAAMDHVCRMGVDQVIKQAERLHRKGLQAIAVFPVVDAKNKDELGRYALDDANFLFSAITKIKKHIPNLGIIADVALDPAFPCSPRLTRPTIPWNVLFGSSSVSHLIELASIART